MTVSYAATDLDLPPIDDLPIPRGYKILIYVPEVKSLTKGGIHIPDQLLQREKTASIVGLVLAVGPDAYNSEKFPSGAYCKECDWVMFHSYSGNRFRVKGKEFRLINDDTVEAVVSKPDLVERA